MTASKQKTIRIIVSLVGGTVLNIVLLAFAGSVLESKLELPQHFREAQRSPAAAEALAATFRAKDTWVDFAVIPIVGCLIGVYAALLQKRRPALLAIGCLLPLFVYEVMTEPVRAWPSSLGARYLGMRLLGFFLAVLVAATLRTFLDKRVLSERMASV